MADLYILNDMLQVVLNSTGPYYNMRTWYVGAIWTIQFNIKLVK